jgi:predicted RNA binding protein YcfA (HicA-like mRNA interferase family)
MAKFPVDAPKRKVIKTLEVLGFQLVREREHISMMRENVDGSKIPLTMPNHPIAGSILQIEPKRLGSGCKPEPAVRT